MRDQPAPDFQRLGEGANRISPADDLICVPTCFYFVWTKTGHMPRKAHDTLAEATAEASRLARANPGKKFIVLEAVQKIVAAPVEHVQAAAA